MTTDAIARRMERKEQCAQALDYDDHGMILEEDLEEVRSRLWELNPDAGKHATPQGEDMQNHYQS